MSGLRIVDHLLIDMREQPFTPDSYDQGELMFWGEPESMVVQNGLVVRWEDMGPEGLVFNATGSVPYDTAGQLPGAGPGLIATNYLQAAVSESDEELTFFLITRQFSTAGGAIVDASDNGSSNRSINIRNDSGFRACNYAGNGHAFTAFTSLAPVLEHYSFDIGGRGMWFSNLYMSDTNDPAAAFPKKTITSIRLLDYRQGLGGFDGLITALAIIRGTPSEPKIAAHLGLWSRKYGLVPPKQLWRPAPATVSTGDPRMVLPEVIHTFVGERLDIYKDVVHYRDGFTEQGAESDLEFVERSRSRWSFAPEEAGDYQLTVTEAGYSQNATIRAIEQSGLTGQKVFCMVGDSITEAASIPWRFRELLGAAHAQMVGTVTTAPVNDVQHEGRGFRDATWYATHVDSPFTDGAGAINPASINAWIGALAAPPQVIFWILGTNDFRLLTDGTIEAGFNTYKGHIDTMRLAISAQLPSVSHFIVPPFGGNADTSSWQFIGGEAGRLQFRRCMHRAVERVRQDYGGRQAERIYVSEPYVRVDPERHYRGPTFTDPYHPTYIGGAKAIAETLAADVRALWPLL